MGIAKDGIEKLQNSNFLTKKTQKRDEMKLFNTFIAFAAGQNLTDFSDYDGEHKKQWQSLVIRDFDATTDKLLDTFFVSVKQSKAFRQNQQKIIREDRAFCEAGEDDFGA